MVEDSRLAGLVKLTRLVIGRMLAQRLLANRIAEWYNSFAVGVERLHSPAECARLESA